jgi:hypothetical protein
MELHQIFIGFQFKNHKILTEFQWIFLEFHMGALLRPTTDEKKE